MFVAQLGKYKSIIVSIALFLILDASVMILNFYISFEISEDAAGVNLAGRQRMLSQRMVKSLLDMDYSIGNQVEQDLALKELNATVNLFDETLKAFDKGGSATGADGVAVALNRVKSSDGVEAISDAKALWGPYKILLEDVVSAKDEQSLSLALTAAVAYGRQNNVTLLKQMNRLTVDLENFASSKAARLRWIQTIGISLAVINFFIILFHFLGQLKEGDRKLDVARRETEKIMDTVNEGLFLIDKDLKVASQHSTKLVTMFGREKLSGFTFESLLADMVSDKDLQTSKRFIALLFREDIKSNLISDLNPLKELEVNISEASGGFVNKFFRFEFDRAYDNGAVKNILVTVNDVTDKVQLSRELALAKEQTEQQLEVLTGIIHTNPIILKRFVSSCFGKFKDINRVLREPAKSDSTLRKKLNDIFVEIHNFKGEAGALGLESFETLAHMFETDIIALRAKGDITGDDFFSLVVQLDKLIRHAEMVQSLSEKLSAFSDTGAEQGKAVADQREWEHLSHLADTVAKRTDKKVELVTSGLTEVALSDPLKSLISDISVQCIRNAIFHGIETPQDRLESYKTELGRIDLRLAQASDGNIELTIRDDGQGFDFEAIRARAIETGKWSEQELESWDSKRLASLIFEPGFSTADVETLDAGRGVGMDVIRERISQFRGKIRISSRRGACTSFQISIPPLIGEELAA